MKHSQFYLKVATLAGFVLLIAGFVLYRSGSLDVLLSENEKQPVQAENSKTEAINPVPDVLPAYSMEQMSSSKSTLLYDYYKKRLPRPAAVNREPVQITIDSPILPPLITIKPDTSYRRYFDLMPGSKIGPIFSRRDSLSRLYYQIDTAANKPAFMMPGSKSAPVFLQEQDTLKKKDKN